MTAAEGSPVVDPVSAHVNVVASRPGTRPKPGYSGADPEPCLAQVEPEWTRFDALASVETHRIPLDHSLLCPANFI